MDLYSSVRWLEQPFVFASPEDHLRLPIDARGLIGDGHTTALVRVDGAIDWACLPRFDSPSAFAGMLDPRLGGSCAITPASHPFQSVQRYEPETNVLETLFRVEGQGVASLVDYMPWSDDPMAAVHEIHRRLVVIEGTVDFAIRFDPRFDYGRGKTEIEIQEYGVLARGEAGERLAAVLGGDASWSPLPAGGVEARVRVESRQARWLVLRWDAERAESLAAYRPQDYLRSTRRNWRRYAGDIAYDGPWHDAVVRSALVLKLLIYEPTGAMVAAPTTSLPEWLGGGRNWDYRYTWTRDAAMAIRASNLIGHPAEARDFFHFIRNALHLNERLQVMYTVDGQPVPEEEELSHLAGFAGSTPVRIGNGARDQLQLDTAGALVDCAHLYERFGGALPLRTWHRIRDVVDDLEQTWVTRDDGIWEPRGARQHNVHSKVMCWLAFDRASGLAPRFGASETGRRWARAAELVSKEVRQHGVDPSGRYFTATYGSDHVDGALLVLMHHGFVEPDHPLMAATVKRIREELGSGPFLHRYRVEDGVAGPEGAFVLCGFWLAEALAMRGELDDAMDVFKAHVDASNHLGLLAEEVDPGSRAQLGNFPQAFSHLGLINAAVRIGLGLRMRDEGSGAVPHATQRLLTPRS